MDPLKRVAHAPYRQPIWEMICNECTPDPVDSDARKPVFSPNAVTVRDSTLRMEDGGPQGRQRLRSEVGDAMKIRPGDIIRIRDLTTLNDDAIRVPDPRS